MFKLFLFLVSLLLLSHSAVAQVLNAITGCENINSEAYTISGGLVLAGIFNTTLGLLFLNNKLPDFCYKNKKTETIPQKIDENAIKNLKLAFIVGGVFSIVAAIYLFFILSC